MIRRKGTGKYSINLSIKSKKSSSQSQERVGSVGKLVNVNGLCEAFSWSPTALAGNWWLLLRSFLSPCKVLGLIRNHLSSNSKENQACIDKQGHNSFLTLCLYSVAVGGQNEHQELTFMPCVEISLYRTHEWITIHWTFLFYISMSLIQPRSVNTFIQIFTQLYSPLSSTGLLEMITLTI